MVIWLDKSTSFFDKLCKKSTKKADFSKKNCSFPKKKIILHTILAKWALFIRRIYRMRLISSIANEMKNLVLTFIIVVSSCTTALSQEVGEYGFLALPVSPHAAALGGTAISVVEPEAALADQNPALLCPSMAKQVNLSYMRYISDVSLGNASYTGRFIDLGGWQAGVRYVDYGNFKGYDESGTYTGSFSAKDIAWHYGVGYPLGERWQVGATARAIYTKYAENTAFALGVDVGLNYYNEGSGRSFSAVVSNLGGQLKTMEGCRSHWPTQLALGVTKEVEHLPFCFTLTAIDLFDWKQNYVNALGEEHRYSNAEQVLNHVLWGVEWIASDAFYLAGGYSLRRQREFSGDGGFLRGLSIGAGLSLKHLNAQISYASYNAAAGSLLLGVSLKL